ncbi:unnamed protein product [Moneuplotes crassus]|uniref:Uncharacterized protein n=1 Tax=Euplotes crassus TaxID=5936 RepID=A0AAD1XLB1_EUPCR|nr:unnamed protein product [Moneuplotes crassus]
MFAKRVLLKVKVLNMSHRIHVWIYNFWNFCQNLKFLCKNAIIFQCNLLKPQKSHITQRIIHLRCSCIMYV